ncbi:MarR family transcriptional regulator [Kineosporia sp. J2-2]|uniref:MarR family transcriptional regulator n=1 Tax=Kineosporia corallincola TaxID=2835133 RepID=A0ABS5T8T1_9ACTN|nr:MarR family transcriptional regulator [Kineosporia corallincola]MBT0767482.1 MarR family transcriptional regulator [Kineosporia corallincola]
MLEETELRVSLMKVTRRLRAEKSDTELTDSQMSVLSVLDRGGPLTPRALADYERVQPPSMTRTLAALAERGLVDRAPDPGDGRQIIVRITDSGAAAVTATRRQRDAWLAQQLADLDPDERAVLARASQILRRIADS